MGGSAPRERWASHVRVGHDMWNLMLSSPLTIVVVVAAAAIVVGSKLFFLA